MHVTHDSAWVSCRSHHPALLLACTKVVSLIPGFALDKVLDAVLYARVRRWPHCRVAAEAGVTPAQLALAFCRSRWFVPSTLVGATSLTQLAENLAAFTDPCAAAVTDDVLSELVRWLPPHPP